MVLTCRFTPERLDRMLIPGERHRREGQGGYVRHHNGHRPHQSLRQDPSLRQPGRVVDISIRIERRQVPSTLISKCGPAGPVDANSQVSI